MSATRRKPRTPAKPTAEELRERARRWLERLLREGECASSDDRTTDAGQSDGRPAPARSATR